MIRLACLALVLAACGSVDESDGTIMAPWTLADSTSSSAPTCDSYKIADVVMTATDTSSGNTKMVSATCGAGTAQLDLPLGTYKIKLEAMGTAGDVAGSKEVMGSLDKSGMVVTLAATPIPVAAPASKAHAIWTLKKLAATTTCSQVSNTGVQITLMPMGGTATTDIWDCTEPNATVDVPYGAFTAKADLLGNAGSIVASSQVTPVDAGRGVVMVPLTIDVP